MELVEQYGVSCPMGSRLMTGNTVCHLELEDRIAAFKRRPSALVFSAGAMATMGTIACLARPGDLLVLDEYARQPCLRSEDFRAEVRVFRHNDLDHLESILRKVAGSRSVAVVVDGSTACRATWGRSISWWR